MSDEEHRWRSRAQSALPADRVDAVLLGQLGVSPTVRAFASLAVVVAIVAALLVVVHARLAVVIVLAVPVLLVVAACVAVLTPSRLVAVTPDGLVVLEANAWTIGREVARVRDQLVARPYWDDRFARVAVGDTHLWVNVRHYGPVIAEYARVDT